MSQCGDDGASSPCDQSSTDSSAVSEEGKWLGISFGALVLIIVIGWFIQTCRQPQRRQRAKNKLLALCFGKRQHHMTANTEHQRQDQQPKSAVGAAQQSNGSLTKCENGSVSRSKPNGALPSSGDDYNDAEDPLDTCGFTLEDVLRHEDETASGDGEDDDEYYDDNGIENVWKKRNGNVGVKNGKPRKRHSRASLHSLSITLETIQEELNEARHSHSEPEIHIRNEINGSVVNERDCVIKNNNNNNNNNAPTHRSKSLPAKLCGMIISNNLDEVKNSAKDLEKHEDDNNDISNKPSSDGVFNTKKSEEEYQYLGVSSNTLNAVEEQS